MAIGERIKEQRTRLKMTQTDLANKVGLSYIQIGRYEKQKSRPSSTILQRLASNLETTTDYLMNGSSFEENSAQLTDKELLNQFMEVEKLNKEDKYLIKTFIDAFILKRKVQNLVL